MGGFMCFKYAIGLVLAAFAMSNAGTVVDRDGNEYQTVSIPGFDQVWMAEDLLVGSSSKVDWTTAMNLSSDYLQSFYGDDNPAQGVCPEGWRLPSAQEWNNMLNFLSLNNGGEEGDCGNDDCTSKSWDLYVFSNSGLDLPSRGGYWTSSQTMDLDGAEYYANGIEIGGSKISLERLASKDKKLKIRCIHNESDPGDYLEDGDSQEYDTEVAESPEVSQQDPCDERNFLNLSVAITEDYMVIGARGGFQPDVYFYPKQERNGVRYVAIQKESERERGRIMWALYSGKNGMPDSVYLDDRGNFFKGVGEGVEGRKIPDLKQYISPGKYVTTLGKNSLRRLSYGDVENAVVAPLSAFDVVARDLQRIHTSFTDLDDANDVLLVVSSEASSKNELLKRLKTYRPLVQTIKNVGYTNINLALIGENYYKFIKGGENAGDADRQKFFGELYSALGLKMPTREEVMARNACAGAYDLMKNQKFSKDIDKVLNDVAGLQTTGKSQLGGRRGKADGGSNEGYAEGGIGDGLAGLLGGKAKGSIKTPSERDIDMGAGDGSRGKAEIMKVMRQRTPGLRHIYNKFLKKRPGFSGRVTLKFTIAPGGEIISISIASSTTGYAEFDNEIKNAVKRWTFGTVNSGNTTVSIPFSFAE